MSTPMPSSLPWPTEAPAIPLLTARPVLDRISSLARTHEQDVTLVPGLAVNEEEIAADPPPALEQILDELSGIELRGIPVLNLVIEDRTDVGPYTLLGAATTFYPLYETPEAAVVLTIDDDGAPGVVYGIGEDLALRLAAPDLIAYLERFADALDATLNALALRGDESDPKGVARTEAAQELIDLYLFTALVGEDEEEDEADGTAHAAAEGPAVKDVTGEGVSVPLQDPAASEISGLPEGALLVADLRDAPLGAHVDLIDAEVPGDPLDLRVAWREHGRLITLHTS
ncbi:hypothetical protein [Brachybacterium tyrofermentans]|uniref:Uncharacterized protein n=1 Tax=Brachybacterium tyrofermentans TaxID=47848 RepID=A0ABW0FK87_9MICO|nr:hypothetical protein [Brachybacterium tyrofermentans]